MRGPRPPPHGEMLIHANTDTNNVNTSVLSLLELLCKGHKAADTVAISEHEDLLFSRLLLNEGQGMPKGIRITSARVFLLEAREQRHHARSVPFLVRRLHKLNRIAKHEHRHIRDCQDARRCEVSDQG